MTSQNAEALKLDPSALVSLFQLDTSSIDGPVYRFTTETRLGAQVSYGGNLYYAVPVRMTGMSVSGQGPLAVPKMAVGNTDGFIEEIIALYGDIEGCTLSRIRTYERFLDDGSDPDPTAYYGPDVYTVDRKSSDTAEAIEWELSALIDQVGVYVGRTVVRDICLWPYRRWNAATGAFDYSKAKCPYAGDVYFDAENKAVLLPSEDKPSRNVSCCKTRFGENAALPFGGFPGIVRGAR